MKRFEVIYRIIILIVPLFCLISAMKAEDTDTLRESGKVVFSIKTGISSNAVSKYEQLFGEELSLKIGFGIEFPISKTWAIEPSLYYTKKKFNIKGQIEYWLSIPYSEESVLRLEEDYFLNSLRYIEMPITLVKNIYLNHLNVKLKGGGYFAYGLSARAKYYPDPLARLSRYVYFGGNMFNRECLYGDISYMQSPEDKSELIPLHSGPYHRWDWGVAFGTDMAWKHFVIGLDVMISCKPFTRHFNGAYTLSNRTISLMIGCRF